MVKLLAIIIFDTSISNPKIIYSKWNLSGFGFFERSTIQDVCIFFSTESVKKCSQGSFEVMTHLNYNIHTKSYPNIAFTCITDDEYPLLAARSFINKVDNIFQKNPNNSDNLNPNNKHEIEDLFTLCQDPTKADKLLVIKAELDETKEILMKTIDDLLDRGESMEDLLKKAENLNDQSKLFLMDVKRMNSCCTIF